MSPQRDRSPEPADPVSGLHTAALAVLFLIPVVVLVEGLMVGNGRLALTSVPATVLVLAAVRALVLRERAHRVAAAAGSRAALPVRVLAGLWAVCGLLSAVTVVGVLNLPG